MNALRKQWITLALLGTIVTPVATLAQDASNNTPPPPRDDRGSDRRDFPPQDDRDNRPPPPRDGRRADGPPGRQTNVPPVGEAGSPQVRAMMGYLALVEQYKQLTKDPTAAGVAAVVTAGDVLRSRGPQAAIDYFEKLLPKVKSLTIQNAIRLQLVDFYRASNNPDKALEHLSALITSDFLSNTDVYLERPSDSTSKPEKKPE